jgi:hypothetical protein
LNFGARQNQQATLLLDGFQGSWKKIFKKIISFGIFSYIYEKKP